MLLIWGFIFPQVLFAQPEYEVSYAYNNASLAEKNVHSVYQDKQSIIWIGNNNGLYRFDNQSINKTTINGHPVTEGVVNTIIEDPSGALWITSKEKGLIIINTDRNTYISPQQYGLPKFISQNKDIEIDRKKNGDVILFAHPNLYCYSWSNKKLVKLASVPKNLPRGNNSLKYSERNQQVYLLVESKGSPFLFRLYNKKLEKLNKPIYYKSFDHQLMPYSASHLRLIKGLGDSVSIVSEQYLLCLGEKYFTTEKKYHLTHILPQWASVQQAFQKMDNLPFKQWSEIELRNIFIAQTGHWLLATNTGLWISSKHKNHRLKNLEAIQGQNIRSIYSSDSQKLLIGTHNGLYEYSLHQKKIQHYPGLKTIRQILPIDLNTYWLALESYEGIRQMHKATHTPSALAYSNLLDIGFPSRLISVKNGVWVSPGGSNDLYFLQAPEGIPTFHLKLKTSKNVYFQQDEAKPMLLSRDSSLWVAGLGGLCHVLHAGNKPERATQDVAVPAELRQLIINDLYEDIHSRLWIASQKGLYLYDPVAKKIVQHITQAKGIVHNHVTSILGSHQDSLMWLGTQGGLSCLDVITGRIANFFERDGLAHNEFNALAKFEGKDGTLYFGSIFGLTYFRPWRPKASPTGDRPYAEFNIQHINGVQRRVLPKHGETVILKPLERYIQLGLHLNPLLNGTESTYRYKLSKIVDNWTLTRGKQELVFTTIPSGTYTLSLQAILPEGAWSKTYYLTIKVQAIWYKTTWFIGLSSLSLVTLSFCFYRFRVKQLKREYDIRKQVTADLHDNLSSRLYSIRMIVDQILDPGTRENRRKGLTERLHRLSIDSQQIIRTFIWAFDPKNNTLGALIEKLILFSKNTIAPLIEGQVQLCPITEALQTEISPQVAHHVLMAYQELLTNAIKHTRVEKLTIEMQIDKSLIFTIRINNFYSGLSIPFPSSTFSQEEHWGLESITARMEKIGSELRFTAIEGHQLFVLLISLRIKTKQNKHV